MTTSKLRSHYSGLWIGEAVPDPSFAEEIPTNPIKWALTILTNTKEDEVSVFGAGYFDDSGDIPGEPVLFFTVHGKFESATRKIRLEKVYDTRLVSEEVFVTYEGALKLDSADGQPVIEGTWFNSAENVSGVFAARLEEP